MNSRGGRGSPASHDGFGGVDGGRKERNEAYFARLGSENATRSDSVPPSQGGKFTGFGGGMPVSSPSSRSSAGGPIPGFDDFQKDPMAALTKGFGWFTTAVGKSAKTVNDSYIQPTAKTVYLPSLLLRSRPVLTVMSTDSGIRLRSPSPPPCRTTRPKPPGRRPRCRRLL
jgi:ADP-ribosylation factor GTPase-activating protein 1